MVYLVRRKTPFLGPEFGLLAQNQYGHIQS